MNDGGPTRSRLALRRRPSAEQRVIHMLRGDDIPVDGAAPFHAGQFGKLRTLAERHGFTIARPGTPYVTVHELTLLGWLASAQRVQGYSRACHYDAMLAMTVVHCAGTLDALGIRLPALAIQHGSPRMASA